MELKEEAGIPAPLTEAEPPSARGPGGAGPSPPTSPPPARSGADWSAAAAYGRVHDGQGEDRGPLVAGPTVSQS